MRRSIFATSGRYINKLNNAEVQMFLDNLILVSFAGFSFASVMEQANACTMGYCIDDIKDDKLLHDIVIATYNKVIKFP
jgi:hypothetical protein